MDNPTLPSMFVQVLASLVALLMITYYALGIWKEHLREQPNPAQTYAKETDCLARSARLETDCKTRHAEARGEVSILASRVEQAREKEESAAAERRKSIYDMIRQTEVNLRADMKEGFRNVDSQLSGINRALGRLEGHPNE